jgi:hypothetical protein
MVKIHFTNKANAELALLCALDNEKTGFIFGVDMGNNKIIETILPVNFHVSNVARLYHTVYKKKGNSLLGVFFLNKDFFLNDCFFENIILLIKDGQKKVYKYGFNENCGKKGCTLIYSQ